MKNLRFVSMAILALGLMLVNRTTSAQVVTTLAGSGGRGSLDGNGAQASFSVPFGLAVDSAENVYVVDFGNHKIRKITPSGTVTTLAGSGNVMSEIGVARDASGDLYVADGGDEVDGGLAKILKIAPGTPGSHHGLWKLR